MTGYHQDTESSRFVAESVDSSPISPYVMRRSLDPHVLPEPVNLRFSGLNDSPMLRVSHGGFEADLDKLNESGQAESLRRSNPPAYKQD